MESRLGWRWSQQRELAEAAGILAECNVETNRIARAICSRQYLSDEIMAPSILIRMSILYIERHRFTPIQRIEACTHFEALNIW